MNRVYVHLSWVAFIAVPLAGVIVQYHTRRAWLTVSGCVLAATVVTVFHPPLPLPNTRGTAASRDPQNFSEQVTVKNVTVSVHDGNVTVSGNFETPAQRQFECTISPPLFVTADGETIELRRMSTAIYAQGGVYVDGKMISPGGQVEFNFVLSFAELKKIRGKIGTLWVRVGGKFFHYAPLTVIPLDSKQWTVVNDTRITIVKWSEDADSDTVAEVLFFSARKDDAVLVTDGYNYQYSLCHADRDGEISLRGREITRVSDLSLGAVFVRLNALAPLPEKLEGWSIRIDRRVYDSRTTSGTELTIPNFTASGMAPAAAEKF
jgi:hypothetical protein